MFDCQEIKGLLTYLLTSNISVANMECIPRMKGKASRGRKKIKNTEWSYVISKVSDSEKGSRRSWRMKSFKQKMNVMNMLHRRLLKEHDSGRLLLLYTALSNFDLSCAEYHPLITCSISLVLCFCVYANFLCTACGPCSPSAVNSRLYCLGCRTLSTDSFRHCFVTLTS